jgi:hypothetical protein
MLAAFGSPGPDEVVVRTIDGKRFLVEQPL